VTHRSPYSSEVMSAASKAYLSTQRLNSLSVLFFGKNLPHRIPACLARDHARRSLSPHPGDSEAATPLQIQIPILRRNRSFSEVGNDRKRCFNLMESVQNCICGQQFPDRGRLPWQTLPAWFGIQSVDARTFTLVSFAQPGN
jgi:hypothetical protein